MGCCTGIGYSFWDFLGPGVTDTPDGGRSHRRVLVDGLHARGHEIVFLQPDRDHTEAGLDLSEHHRWDVGHPRLDILVLEWRWPIPGRNTTWCGAAGHTCDQHRQQNLVEHYTLGLGTRTLLRDKDRRPPAEDPLRHREQVVVCEAALCPSPGAVPLLFPVADTALDGADPGAVAACLRELPLVYVGNQYDRDDAFTRFFAPVAAHHDHVVAGKWTRTDTWPLTVPCVAQLAAEGMMFEKPITFLVGENGSEKSTLVAPCGRSPAPLPGNPTSTAS